MDVNLNLAIVKTENPHIAELLLYLSDHCTEEILPEQAFKQ